LPYSLVERAGKRWQKITAKPLVLRTASESTQLFGTTPDLDKHEVVRSSFFPYQKPIPYSQVPVSQSRLLLQAMTSRQLN
jgi:hypothetical protein